MRGLYLSIIFTVLTSLFVIGWGFDKLAEHAVTDQNSQQESNSMLLYRQLIQGLAQQLNDQPEEILPEAVRQFQQQYKIDSHIVLSNDIALPNALLPKVNDDGGLLLASQTDQYLLKKLNQHPSYLIQINIPFEQEENNSFNFILTVALYLSVCGILILWAFPLSRRLYLLNNAAAKIGEGQFSVRITPSKFSYIKMLEKSFNSMASQIEKLVADNKILARSLSHDIRTPMACLRFGLEAAIDSKSPEKKNSYLARMDNELTNMEEMTSAFLEYASMERQALRLERKIVNANELINSAINDCQTIAKQKNIAVTLQAPKENIEFLLDYHWCYRALINLISNAIGFATKEVLLSLSVSETSLVIKVEDDGKGIDEDKLDIIFTPFVKLEAERSREQGHFGLGLAICAKVIDWHQGKISATNNNTLSGACFKLVFPKKH